MDKPESIGTLSDYNTTLLLFSTPTQNIFEGYIVVDKDKDAQQLSKKFNITEKVEPFSKELNARDKIKEAVDKYKKDPNKSELDQIFSTPISTVVNQTDKDVLALGQHSIVLPLFFLICSHLGFRQLIHRDQAFRDLRVQTNLVQNMKSYFKAYSIANISAALVSLVPMIAAISLGKRYLDEYTETKLVPAYVSKVHIKSRENDRVYPTTFTMTTHVPASDTPFWVTFLLGQATVLALGALWLYFASSTDKDPIVESWMPKSTREVHRDALIRALARRYTDSKNASSRVVSMVHVDELGIPHVFDSTNKPVRIEDVPLKDTKPPFTVPTKHTPHPAVTTTPIDVMAPFNPATRVKVMHNITSFCEDDYRDTSLRGRITPIIRDTTTITDGFTQRQQISFRNSTDPLPSNVPLPSSAVYNNHTILRTPPTRLPAKHRFLQFFALTTILQMTYNIHRYSYTIEQRLEQLHLPFRISKFYLDLESTVLCGFIGAALWYPVNHMIISSHYSKASGMRMLTKITRSIGFFKYAGFFTLALGGIRALDRRREVIEQRFMRTGERPTEMVITRKSLPDFKSLKGFLESLKAGKSYITELFYPKHLPVKLTIDNSEALIENGITYKNHSLNDVFVWE